MLVDGYVRVAQVRGPSRPQFISPSEPAGPIRDWAALHGHTVANVWEQLDESGASADPATALALASSEAILICNTVVEAGGLPRPRDARGGGVGALTGELREFLDRHPVGVLATRTAGDGPRQSVVYFACDGERLMISTLTDRLKAQDVRRTGWASLCVMGHRPPYPSDTFSSPAEILTEDIGGPTARIAQRISGATEPPEPMSDAALAEVGRVILAITIERVTAANYIEATTTSAEAGGERN